VGEWPKILMIMLRERANLFYERTVE